jgi:hypothetical protein
VTPRPTVAYPRDLDQEDQHFHSGINDKGEVCGIMGSGRHVGITASCMRPGMLRELAIGRHGLTRLFVDSGAFSEVTFGPYRVVKAITDEEWQRRFRLYRWSAATFRGRAYLVAPDRVGDQDVTLDRLVRYARDMACCAALGANIIVPVQKGDRAMAWMFQRACAYLVGVPREQIIAGIPMQKDATSIDELRAFCEYLPWFGARIHLLGIGPRAKLGRFWRAVEAIKAVRPNAQITSDSALVPSLVGRTNGPSGGPRILTALQDEARTLGLKGHETKRYGLMRQGFAEIDADRIRAEDAGWFDEELFDSVEEARAHRLAVEAERNGNANVGKLALTNLQVAGQLAFDLKFLHPHATT